MCKSTECQNCKNNNGVWVISNEILDKETLDNIFKEALSEINKGACKATVKIVPQEEIDNILNKYIGEQVSEEKVESSTIEVTKESVKGKVEKMEMNLNKEELTINKKETLEFVLNGLKDQFTELGSLMKIAAGETAEIAQAKISTGNTMIIIATLLDNLEESKKTVG